MVDEYGYEGNYGTTWGSFSGREIVEMHWAITLAGAYASHGESFADAGAPPDQFLGEAPPRLAFLKKIMMEAPYREMEPAADVTSGGGPSVRASDRTTPPLRPKVGPGHHILMKIRRRKSQFSMYQSIHRTTSAVRNPTNTVPAQPSIPLVNGLTMRVSQWFPPSSEKR